MCPSRFFHKAFPRSFGCIPVSKATAVELAARVAFFCFTKITLKPTWLHPKDTGIDGCLGGAHFFRSWVRFAFYFFFVWGPPHGEKISLMVEGVSSFSAFSFLEVIFSRDFRAREISRLFKIVGLSLV